MAIDAATITTIVNTLLLTGTVFVGISTVREVRKEKLASARLNDASAADVLVGASQKAVKLLADRQDHLEKELEFLRATDHEKSKRITTLLQERSSYRVAVTHLEERVAHLEEVCAASGIVV